MTAPMFAELPRMSASDRVVARIEELIVSKQLKPGDALPAERELASMMAVSRNVLREATSALAQRRLIEIVPGRGTFVTERSSEGAREAIRLLMRRLDVDVVQLCEARLLIEPELAARAAQNATAENTEALETAFARLLERAGDPTAHVDADLAFHQTIAEMADQPVLRAMVEAVSDSVTLGMLLGSTVTDAEAISDRQHTRIRDAVVAGDATAARAAMHEHISFTRDYLTSLDNEEIARMLL